MNPFEILQIFLMSIIVLIKAENNVFCYYHMLKAEEFNFNDLDPSLCSHLVYDDFKIEEGTGKFIPSQPELLFEGISGKHVLRKLAILKIKYTNLKILASIGQLDSYETLSSMMSNPIQRAKFIDTTIDFLTMHDFDGLNFGWILGKNNNDKNNHAILVKDLNDKLTKNKKLLVLCVAALPIYTDLYKLYNIQEIAKYANFIIMRTFEMRRDFTKVGFDSALYPSYDDDVNIKSLVEFWLGEGVPSEKLIIHISTIGRKYILANTLQSTSVGAPADLTKKPESSIYYNKVCYELQNNTDWVERWDNIQKAPYAYKTNIWINYDNIESVKLKTKFICDMKLGGISFGPLQYDDYNGKCKTGNYPLLNTIYSNLKMAMDEYKYIINMKIIKRHIRNGEIEQIYQKEEEFGVKNYLF